MSQKEMNLINYQKDQTKFKLKKIYNKYLVIDILAFSSISDFWIDEFLYRTNKIFRQILIQYYKFISNSY